MKSSFQLSCSATILCFALSNINALAEDFSFDAWEASLELEVGKKKSSLETIGLEPASVDELSDTAIANALKSQVSGFSKPAYQTVDEEQGEKQEESSQSLVFKQESETNYKELDLPEMVEFEQPIYSAPNGRTLDHNNQAFERP